MTESADELSPANAELPNYPDNPAGRVAAVIAVMKRIPHAKPSTVPGQSPQLRNAFDVYVHAFGVSESTPLRQRARTQELIAELADEVERAIDLGRRTHFSEEYFVPQLTQIASGMTLQSIHGNWRDVDMLFSGENFLALRMLAETIRSQGIAEYGAPPLDALREVLRLASELEDVIGGSGLSRDLQSFLFTLVNAVRRAVQQYPTGHATALRQAYAVLVFEMATRADELSTAPVKVAGARKARSAIVALLLSLGATLKVAVEQPGVTLINIAKYADAVHHVAEAIEDVEKQLRPKLNRAGPTKEIGPGETTPTEPPELRDSEPEGESPQPEPPTPV